jgi:predicted transcriptional regulator
MSTEAFTVRTDPATAQRLDTLASRLDRSRNYLVNQAIKDYLAMHAWQIEKTLEGMQAADRGEVMDHATVMAEMDTLIQGLIDAHGQPQ